jgi:hypothetical protein
MREPDDNDQIPLEDVNLDELGISEGFDYRAYQKSAVKWRSCKIICSKY